MPPPLFPTPLSWVPANTVKARCMFLKYSFKFLSLFTYCFSLALIRVLFEFSNGISVTLCWFKRRLFVQACPSQFQEAQPPKGSSKRKAKVISKASQEVGSQGWSGHQRVLPSLASGKSPFWTTFVCLNHSSQVLGSGNFLSSLREDKSQSFQTVEITQMHGSFYFHKFGRRHDNLGNSVQCFTFNDFHDPNFASQNSISICNPY